MKNGHTPLYRIKKVLDHYYRMGANRESVNKIYHKIIKKKFGIYKKLINLAMSKHYRQENTGLNCLIKEPLIRVVPYSGVSLYF